MDKEWSKRTNKEAHQKLVFDYEGWILLHMRKQSFLMQMHYELIARDDGWKIGENTYQLKLFDDYISLALMSKIRALKMVLTWGQVYGCRWASIAVAIYLKCWWKIENTWKRNVSQNFPENT